MNNIEFDAQHIWHPYTALPSTYQIFEIIKTQHTTITLADGRELIDGMSSWWSAIHGYNHPLLLQAMHSQINDYSHIMFGGLTHKPAINLARKLIAITPNKLEQVFFSDSGSVAVEVAIKMALQYQTAINKPKKQQILALKGGYHGDTFATMAISDTGMGQIFASNLTTQIFVTKPSCKFNDTWRDNYFAEIKQTILSNKQNLAAIILEPIAQGTGGMNFYHPQYLIEIKQLCNQLDILLIADEIATGFGRTGKLFACEYANISPDILCLGKAITGGMLSLAVTLTTKKISHIISNHPPFALMHGPTFMANPLSCAVALASINLLLSSSWQQNINQIAVILGRELNLCQQLKSVADVRVLGAIGVVELFVPVDMAIIQTALVDAGVWVRPFGKLVYIMPAFTISEVDLLALCNAIFVVLKTLQS